MTSGAKDRPSPPGAVLDHRLLDLLTLISVAFHTFTTLEVARGPDTGLLHANLAGLLVSLLIWGANHHAALRARVPVMFVGLIGAWTLRALLLAAHLRQGLDQWMTLTVVMMALAAFTFMPYRQARWLSALVMGLYGVMYVLSGETEFALLVLVFLIMALGAYLALHGHPIQQTKVWNARLERQVRQDELTGALSRRFMDEQLAALMQEPGRRGVLLVLDLDHFKAVNDGFGHQVGDRALKAATHLMQDCLRDGDLVGRWGGEEFMILLPGQGLETGVTVAGRILERFRTARLAGIPPMTVSIGVAAVSEARSREDLVRLADRRLYAAKEAGRDRAVHACAG